MFQNTEFSEEHCEKLPSIGMMVGNVTVSEVSIGPLPATHNEACKKKKKKALCGSSHGKNEWQEILALKETANLLV